MHHHRCPSTFKLCHSVNNQQLFLHHLKTNLKNSSETSSETNSETNDACKNKESDEHLIVDGGVYWPRIGWEVKYVPDFDPCQDTTYVDQHVPSPLCAHVLTDSSDERVLKSRQFGRVNDGMSRVLTTNEYYSDLKRAQTVIGMQAFAKKIDLYHHWEDELLLGEQRALDNGHASLPETK